jgi:hypothetical protein
MFQDNLRKVLQKFHGAHLKLNPQKCQLFKKEVQHLGHTVSMEGVTTNTQKLKAVSVGHCQGLRSFLGLCTYYRRFTVRFVYTAKLLI